MLFWLLLCGQEMDQTFKMAELHGLICATNLMILFYMKEYSFQAQTISPYSTWYLIQLTLLLLLCVKPICCENSWEFCFRGGSIQTLQMRKMWQFSTLCHTTVRKVHLTLVLLRAKSFQIDLNHSLLCLWWLLHIVLYCINSIYCISGLNCVEQVNAHCYYVLAYPIFSNLILFNACQVNFSLTIYHTRFYQIQHFLQHVE